MSNTQPAPRRWTVRRTVLAAVAGLAIVVTGGVAIAAAGDDGRPGRYGFPGPGGGPGGWHFGGPHGDPGGGRIVAEAVHGEFVAADGQGRYTAYRVQRGTIVTVTGNAVTVRSQDGYTADYALDGASRVDGETVANGRLKAGEQVTVLGLATGQHRAVAVTRGDLLPGPARFREGRR